MSYDIESIKKYAGKNLNKILNIPIVRAKIVELISADEDGDDFVDGVGYDQINSTTNIRTETKYTCSPQQKNKLRIASVHQKYGNFDFIKIVDGVNNRKFVIPHDTFFNRIKITNDKNGCIWWSLSYNKTDNIEINNTQLLLEHEVAL